MDPLEAISPIDGRYRKTTEPLAAFFSERAFMEYRIAVETEYLVALTDFLSDTVNLQPRVQDGGELDEVLGEHVAPLSLESARIIKQIEKQGYGAIPKTEHDLKAIEYFIKQRLQEAGLGQFAEWVHFALTSEDPTNIAYALMVSNAWGGVLRPQLRVIVGVLTELVEIYSALPMLARTHGQPASPTTLGKEMSVFLSRLGTELSAFDMMTISVKFSGATGNFNAHMAAFPSKKWVDFAERFVRSMSGRGALALEFNPRTTQIEPHDTYARFFDAIKRINGILIHFSRDMWRYISDEWFVQRPDGVGSSTMPHKVNPINFENAEGNLLIANALCECFARELPQSRLQRHLADSTMMRNMGVALAHALVGYTSLAAGLKKVAVNAPKLLADLNAHPEVLAEAIQTILRREGVPMPYERLKELTQGRKVTLEDLHRFIDGLAVSDATKAELKALRPDTYIGLAPQLA